MMDSCIMLIAVSMRSRRQFIQLHPSRRISFFSIFIGTRLLGIDGLPFKFISHVSDIIGLEMANILFGNVTSVASIKPPRWLTVTSKFI